MKVIYFQYILTPMYFPLKEIISLYLTFKKQSFCQLFKKFLSVKFTKLWGEKYGSENKAFVKLGAGEKEMR